MREQKVYCEIWPCTAADAAVRAFRPRGVILSGGPSSVYEPEAPLGPPGIFELGVPVLGICYGMQLMAHRLGGEVAKAAGREYGRAHLGIVRAAELFKGFGGKGQAREIVWMSHGDRIERLPPGFKPIATTANSPVAAMADPTRRFYGIQFHPEVAHTPRGSEMLGNFVHGVCGCSAAWDMHSFVDYAIAQIRKTVGPKGQGGLRALRRRRFRRGGAARAPGDRRPAELHLRRQRRAAPRRARWTSSAPSATTST